MNYRLIHDSIISRAKGRPIEGYTERHHIIPKCMGGTNDKNNLVRLTGREHYIIHQLLVKIYPMQQGLALAALRMCDMRPHMIGRSGNRKYEWLKVKHAAETSKRFAWKPLSAEHRAKMSAAMLRYHNP